MKRCVFCGTENDDHASVCVNCHNQLPDRPDGEEQRNLSSFAGPEERQEDRTGQKAEAAGSEERGPASDTGAETVAAGPEAAYPAEPGAAGQEPAAAGAETADPSGEPAAAAAGTEPAGQEAAGPAGTQPGSAPPYADQARSSGDPFADRPEGTASGRMPARADLAGERSVGRGQTYGARQQYEARGGSYDASARDQYGSAGYGYRQAPEEAVGRSDLARMNTAVGSKSILFKSRKMVRGLLFFLATLSFTLMIAANFCNIALPGSMDPKVSNAYYNLTNLDSSLEAVLGKSNGFGTQLLTEIAKQVVSMVVNVNGIISQLGGSVRLSILLIFAVPNVLFALALWIMFAQTRRDRTKFGMGGYTLARVMMVLKFVVACLVLAIGLIISVYFVVVGASSAKFTSSFIQGLIMLIIMIVVAIFTIMYYVQGIFSLKCLKVNVRSGIDIGRVPTYIGIISLLLALVCAGGLFPLAPDDYLGLAAGGSQVLYFFFSGIWVLVYHKVVRRAVAKQA